MASSAEGLYRGDCLDGLRSLPDGRAGHALRDLRARCSDLEYGAFIGLMRGLSYEQMSEQFGCSKKSVDNALSRFRRTAAAMGLLDYLTQIE
jgi:hypothetical protein